MTIETLRALLLWSAVVNYGIVLVWFLMFTLAHEWLYRFHGRWFQISREHFDAIHYGSMSLYKIGVLLLNVAPFVALLIIS